MKKQNKDIQILVNLYRNKELTKAESLNRKLIKAYPNDVILYNLLGLILSDQKKYNEAIKYYEDGIKIDPNYALIHNNIGSLYQIKKNYDKAKKSFKKSIEINPKIAEPHNNLGNLYRRLNDYEKSIICYKKAIALNPKYFAFHYNLAVTYKSIGNFELSKKYFKETVKLHKNFFTAHRNLSELIKYKKNDEHLKQLNNLYINEKINKNYKTELFFALGKAYHDIKDFNKSFDFIKKGNDLHRNNISFSIKNEKKEFLNIKKFFDKKLFNTFKVKNYLDDTAIFIVGLPRSGTTLVEQILSSHPSVYGGDELNFIPNLLKKYFSKKQSYYFFDKIKNTSATIIKSMGEEYIFNLKKISLNSPRITDKLPVNFKWIGFIKLILPNAKIVHCMRSPKDNCFSIYKNYFTNPELNFSYNLDEIVEYYKLYKNLMNHWKYTLPNFVYNLEYEQLVENPKKEIFNLLKSCNLKWNDNCLKFYENRRPIKTTSDIQARKKIYKTSINSWMQYEYYLKKKFQQL